MFQKVALFLLAATITGLVGYITLAVVGLNPLAAIPLVAVLAKIIIEIVKRLK